MVPAYPFNEDHFPTPSRPALTLLFLFCSLSAWKP
nr:MAG TPA: hypothetical protein [Caudoviricetes sp.]